MQHFHLMRLLDKDLIKSYTQATEFFSLNGLTLQVDELGKVSIIFYACVFNVFPYESNAA